MSVREGEIEVDFGTLPTEKLDGQKPEPSGMKLVDVVVTEPARILLLEFKDPSESGAPAAEQARYAKRLQGDELTSQDLTPKARDSYSFLHLMQRDDRPMLFILLLGAEKLHLDPALLLSLKERLLRRIRQEAATPWKRHYVQECLVVDLAQWNKFFPEYPAQRMVVP